MENFNLIVSPTGQTRKGAQVWFACKEILFMSICGIPCQTRNSVDLFQDISDYVSYFLENLILTVIWVIFESCKYYENTVQCTMQ